ncbi:nucleotide-binding protein [Stenotrophomonas sp. PS02297]|uniref:nucleotide-binding protein n=1 Tax=Stenotrophomonas sp. PS02297 TaxID=2991423 RepID=UPI00249A64EB|nr:nucleotide-binding protein [Stenotrophomonas sp. PS02297]
MRPALFIASSSEFIDLASAMQESLELVAEVTVWSQDVFKLSRYNIESLLEALEASDFGVFMFTPQDVVNIRGSEKLAVRDNVLFELGLFIGKLGRERCFIVIPRGSEETIHLPSDLLGITPALYEANRQDKNLVAALGPAATKIARQVKILSKRVNTGYFDSDSTPDLTEGDIKTLLQSWMGSRPAALNSEVIRFSDTDKELKLPPGSTKKYIIEIARYWDYVPAQQGEQTILFVGAPGRGW